MNLIGEERAAHPQKYSLQGLPLSEGEISSEEELMDFEEDGEKARKNAAKRKSKDSKCSSIETLTSKKKKDNSNPTSQTAGPKAYKQLMQQVATLTAKMITLQTTIAELQKKNTTLTKKLEESEKRTQINNASEERKKKTIKPISTNQPQATATTSKSPDTVRNKPTIETTPQTPVIATIQNAAASTSNTPLKLQPGNNTAPINPKEPNQMNNQDLINQVMQAVHKILDARLGALNARTQPKPTTYSTITAGNNPASKPNKTQQPSTETPTTSATTVNYATTGNSQPETIINKNRKKKTNPIKDNTILLVPTTAETNTYHELRTVKGIQPRKIIRHILFPSGASLITCKNKEDTEEITKLVKEHPKISVKGQKQRVHEVRIHGIPNDYSDQDIALDIENRYNTKPDNIIRVPYQKKPSEGLAVLQLSDELFEKMKNTRTIRIGFEVKRLNTNIYIPRCSNCGLLGHKDNKCTNTKNNHTNEDTCKDCSAYNARIEASNLSSRMKRKLEHSTGNAECPTLLALQRKWQH